MKALTEWNGRLLALGLVLCIVPLIWPSVPPLLDLPGHMGRYRIALDLDGSPALQRYYSYDWALIGNLGVDLLVIPLGSLIGIEAATKLVVISIPLGMGAGFLWAATQVHGRIPPTALLALVFTYAYPFHYGFVNYCLAVAFAALGFALWIRLSGSAAITRAICFVAISGITWLAHAVGWVVLCVLCGSFELWRQYNRHRGWWPALRNTALAVLPLLFPLALMALAPKGAPMDVSGWLQPQSLAKWVLALNRDRWMTYDILCALVLVAIIGLAIIRRIGLSIQPALGWPAAALFALYILAPDAINGSAMVGARIVPYAAAYALLAIRVADHTHRLWLAVALGFLVARILATTASFVLYDTSYTRTLAALDRVPKGGRVATFARQSCQPSFANWANARMQHLGGLAIVRRDAFVNDQWDAQALQLLRVNYPAAAPFTTSPSEVVTLEPCSRWGVRYLPGALDELPRAAFDFVWLLDVPAQARPSRAWLELVHSSPESALYRIKDPVPLQATGS